MSRDLDHAHSQVARNRDDLDGFYERDARVPFVSFETSKYEESVPAISLFIEFLASSCFSRGYLTIFLYVESGNISNLKRYTLHVYFVYLDIYLV